MARTRRDTLGPEGDLPDPATLDAYNKISPDCLKQILAVFVAEAEHQRRLESEALRARITFARRGQIFGLVIGVAAILCGTTAVLDGHD
ncbi:MAG: DUF2335 domain-containing protein [Gemmataceae bacterium]|nr:DUF2335 domain-containing protein [Gemmataceae bacterium]